jgi:hypothetical protein
MRVEEPKITALGNGRSLDEGNRGLGHCVAIWQRLNPKVDLTHVEADRLDFEVEIDAGEILQLFCKQSVVPNSDLGEPVVGDHEGTPLLLVQMVKTDRRDFGPPQMSTAEQSAMAGTDIKIGIDQDRHIETEALDALCDLPNLLLAVSSRIARIRLDLINAQIRNFERASSFRGWQCHCMRTHFHSWPRRPEGRSNRSERIKAAEDIE